MSASAALSYLIQGHILPEEAHITFHDGAKQGYKGSAISTSPRTSLMGNALFWVNPAYVEPSSQVDFFFCPILLSQDHKCWFHTNSLHPNLHLSTSWEPNLRHRGAEIWTWSVWMCSRIESARKEQEQVLLISPSLPRAQRQICSPSPVLRRPT